MITTKKGWTMDYVLNGISWINLRMMIADEIKSKTDYEGGDSVDYINDDDLSEFANKHNRQWSKSK